MFKYIIAKKTTYNFVDTSSNNTSTNRRASFQRQLGDDPVAALQTTFHKDLFRTGLIVEHNNAKTSISERVLQKIKENIGILQSVDPQNLIDVNKIQDLTVGDLNKLSENNKNMFAFVKNTIAEILQIKSEETAKLAALEKMMLGISQAGFTGYHLSTYNGFTQEFVTLNQNEISAPVLTFSGDTFTVTLDYEFKGARVNDTHIVVNDNKNKFGSISTKVTLKGSDKAAEIEECTFELDPNYSNYCNITPVQKKLLQKYESNPKFPIYLPLLLAVFNGDLPALTELEKEKFFEIPGAKEDQNTLITMCIAKLDPNNKKGLNHFIHSPTSSELREEIKIYLNYNYRMVVEKTIKITELIGELNQKFNLNMISTYQKFGETLCSQISLLLTQIRSLPFNKLAPIPEIMQAMAAIISNLINQKPITGEIALLVNKIKLCNNEELTKCYSAFLSSAIAFSSHTENLPTQYSPSINQTFQNFILDYCKQSSSPQIAFGLMRHTQLAKDILINLGLANDSNTIATIKATLETNKSTFNPNGTLAKALALAATCHGIDIKSIFPAQETKSVSTSVSTPVSPSPARIKCTW